MIKGLDYLMISLSSWCISNCSWCNKYLEDNILFNINKVRWHINRLKNIWFLPKSFIFFNYDYFKLTNRELINLYDINLFKDKDILFHTDFSVITNSWLSFLEKHNIKLIFQRNLDYKSIKTFFLSIKHIKKLKVEYVFWVDNNLKLYIFFLNKILDLWFVKKHDNEFILNNSIIKFFFYKWERIFIKNCFFDNSIKVNDDNIFIDSNIYTPNYFEIMINWDIRVHEPPCWYGNLIISNIYRTKLQILEDFNKFSLYIDKFLYINKNINQSMICSKCNKNKYSYKIMDNKLNTN